MESVGPERGPPHGHGGTPWFHLVKRLLFLRRCALPTPVRRHTARGCPERFPFFCRSSAAQQLPEWSEARLSVSPSVRQAPAERPPDPSGSCWARPPCKSA